MEIQAATQPFGNQYRKVNVAKKIEAWFPQKPATSSPTRATRMKQFVSKAKNRSPQRMVSTASSAETVVSQEDYGDSDDTDSEDEDVKDNKDSTNARASAECFETPASIATPSNNEAEQGSAKDCLHYEILLWHGCSIGGIEFASCGGAGHPYVKATDGNESLPGMWNIQEGDLLISVNEYSTHSSTIDFKSVVQIVASGARPAVLRFRRPTLEELQQIPEQKRKPTNEERLGRRRNRERLEKTLSYVIWREGDGPLGVSLKKQPGSLYPVVADMNRSSVVRRHANLGDQLISINQHDIYKLGSKRWVQLLKSAPKPLVLTFRRLGPPPNQKGARTLDL